MPHLKTGYKSFQMYLIKRRVLMIQIDSMFDCQDLNTLLSAIPFPFVLYWNYSKLL